MPNAWIDFVKEYAAKHNILYNEALTRAGREWQKQKKKGRSASDCSLMKSSRTCGGNPSCRWSDKTKKCSARSMGCASKNKRACKASTATCSWSDKTKKCSAKRNANKTKVFAGPALPHAMKNHSRKPKSTKNKSSKK